MYETFYHMKSKAFPVQPVPFVFFNSAAHKGALYYLISGLKEREPFLLVSGNYGMGKTLLYLRLLKILDKYNYTYVDIAPPATCSYVEIIRKALSKLELDGKGQDEEALQSRLFQHLKQNANVKRYISIIIDDAQDYHLSAITSIRRLSSFNIEGFYPFQFVFFAHSSFLDILSSSELGSLDQRIRRRYHLKPFDFNDTREYIYFRLLRSGASGYPRFPDETIELIQEKSGGIPRLINNICDACLLIGASLHLNIIEPNIATEALIFLGLEKKPKESSPDRQPESREESKIAPQPEETPPDFTNIQSTDASGRVQQNQSKNLWSRFLSRSLFWRRPSLSWLILFFVIVSLIIGGNLFGSPLFQRLKEESNPAVRLNSQQVIREKDSKVFKSIANHIKACSKEVTPNSLSQGLGSEDSSPQAISPSAPKSSEKTPEVCPTGGKRKVQGGANSSPARTLPYSLVLASCRYKESASDLVSKLKQKGIPDCYLARTLQNGKWWWVVYQGRYPSREEARKARERLNQPNAIIVKTSRRDCISKESTEKGQMPVPGQGNSEHRS